jgi:hypothetical protein
MKHVVILLLYLYSLKKSTKTESVWMQDYGVAVFTFLLLTVTPFSCSSFISGTIIGKQKSSTMLRLQIFAGEILIFTHKNII